MVMNALREGAKSGVSKFVLFGFLILATGGLVLMDVGGFFRGGVSDGDVAKIGKEEISIRSFDQTVRRTLARLGLSQQEAHRLGYINQLLGGEIRGRLLAQAASGSGVRIADRHIAEQIQQIIAPFTSQGQSPESVLRQILINQGMSERGFVHSIARDMGNELLSTALQSNFSQINEKTTEDLFRFQKEKRDIEYIVFMNSDMKSLPQPDEAQLQGLYEKTKDSFAIDETRRIKLITVDLSALKDRLEIAEENIRQTYEDNIDLYTNNESRLLEQALIPTEAQAQTVVTALEDGKMLEQALKEIIGHSAGYLGKQAFEADNLIEDVKSAVLAAEKPGAILGPLASPLGYYVVVVREITPKQTKSFEEMRTSIREELMEGSLIDEQYAMANTVDDLLAGGASLKELAQEVDVNIQALPAINQYGLNKDGHSALEKYEQDSAEILRSGFELLEGETSPIFETRAGQLMAVHVEHAEPRHYQSFEDIKEALKERWFADQRRVGTQILAAEFLAEIKNSGLALSKMAQRHDKRLYTKKGLERNKDPQGKLILRSVANIFEAPLDTPLLIDIDGGIAIARVTSFSWPETIDPKNEEYQKLRSALAEGGAKESLSIYLSRKQQETGAKINQALLEKVYGPESQSY